jgi:hypothetical protein
MKTSQLTGLRLFNQQITKASYKTAQSLVEWMGAMQAQDYAMAKWAIGTRVAGSTEQQIDEAVDKGEILRTHVLRPTWHFVSPKDIYWMVQLSAPRIKASMTSRHKELELPDKLLAKGNAIIEKALSKGEHLTREQLLSHFTKAKIPIDMYRGMHFLFWAELSCIVCSGKRKGNKQTYALLQERIPKPESLSKEEALAKLAKRYFTSHGPATISDFTWWSGLAAADARNALEMVKDNFISDTSEKRQYWFAGNANIRASKKKQAWLLPAFDEFLVSYKDRSAAINLEHHKKAFTVNGIFKPAIVLNGQVTGLWKRIVKKDTVMIEADLFHAHSNADKELIKTAAGRFGEFVGRKVKIKI